MWTKPMLEELDVTMTANGKKDSYYEYSGWIISTNDSKVPKPEPDPDPEKTES